MNLTDKRILVTGGSGFLGRHLVEALKARGCSLIVPRSRDWDLSVESCARQMFREYRPDVVFHLAAKCGGIGANMERPGEFMYENLAMGVNVIECSREFGVEKLICVGTVCSYPKYTPAPFKEEDLWNGYPEETNAPYGIAKKALLVQCQAYRQQYGLNAIYLIPANLYGPGDNFDLQTSHVIPALIRKFIEAKERGDKTVTIWGDGSATRDFLYVRDCADGLIAAAERYNKPEPVNLGTGEESSIVQIVGHIRSQIDFGAYAKFDLSKPNGQPRRVLDVSRAKAEFEWSASTPFTDGLIETIRWYHQQRKAAA